MSFPSLQRNMLASEAFTISELGRGVSNEKKYGIFEVAEAPKSMNSGHRKLTAFYAFERTLQNFHKWLSGGFLSLCFPG